MKKKNKTRKLGTFDRSDIVKLLDIWMRDNLSQNTEINIHSHIGAFVISVTSRK